MLPRKETPIMLRKNEFQSDNEANEYMSLFLSDMCFWEQTHDKHFHPLLPATPHKESSQPECRTYSPSERTRGEDSLTSSSTNEPLLVEKDLRWRAAVDPVTGRTYYYDTLTRVTQWDKPTELKAWERQQKKEKRKKERNFFREMEHNIIAGLRRGELIPGVPAGTNFLTEKPISLSLQHRAHTEPQPSSSKKSESSNNNKHGVRTISGMDERVLASLNNQNAPSPTNSSAAPSSARRSPENRNPALHGNASRQPQVPGRPPLPQKLVVAPDSDSSSDESPDPPNKGVAHVVDARPSEQKLDATLGGPLFNSHMRRNTGGTIFVKSTMTNPDVKATIKCVCGVYRAHVVQNQERKRTRQPISPNTARVKTEIFRDDYELKRRRKGQIPMPSIEDISTFYFEYFRRSQMEHDTIIMSLIYVERLIKETNGVLAPTTENWRSILFSCMIMASKVWDDLSMWNIDFSNVSVATGITPFSLSRINELELGVLTSLGFDVRVPASEYAKYYFLVRTMLIRSGLLENAAAPLSKEEAKIFENRTNHYQNARLSNQEGAVKARRSRSVDWEWFNQSTQTSPADSRGPVLADKICLEQLVSLEPHQ